MKIQFLKIKNIYGKYNSKNICYLNIKKKYLKIKNIFATEYVISKISVIYYFCYNTAKIFEIAKSENMFVSSY